MLTSMPGAAGFLGWLAPKFPGMIAPGTAALKDPGCLLLPGRGRIFLQQNWDRIADGFVFCRILCFGGLIAFVVLTCA